jgi:cytochrome b
MLRCGRMERSAMDMQATTTIKVWDPWIRLVHWSIVLLMAVSYWSIETERMAIHTWSGYAVLTLVLFRIGWGLVGSETARFSRFLRSPSLALEHLRHFPRREPDLEIGHNAAGGWMVVGLLALLLIQPLTGLFANEEPGTSYSAHGPLAASVSDALSGALTELHEVVFNLILLFAGLHILAVFAYLLVKRQNLVRPMLTGVKQLPAGMRAPRLGNPLLAATLLGAAALAVYGISRLG